MIIREENKNNNLFHFDEIQEVTQDTTKPSLSPYLQKYYFYLYKIDQDSFFYHNTFNINSYSILNKGSDKQTPSLKFFKVPEEENIDSVELIEKEPVETIVAEKIQDTVDTVSITEKTDTTTSLIMNSTETETKQENTIVKKDWFLGVILVSVLLLGWIRLFFRRELRKFIASIADNQASYKVFLEQNTLTRRASFLLNLMFIFNFGYFLFLSLNYYGLNLEIKNVLLNYLAISGIIVLVYIGKFVIYKILGRLLLADKYFNEFLHHTFILLKAYGIALLPIIIGLTYMPDQGKEIVILAGIILFGISSVFRIIRGITICFKAGISLFYMILYLCTLEILPYVVLYKVVS